MALFSFFSISVCAGNKAFISFLKFVLLDSRWRCALSKVVAAEIVEQNENAESMSTFS